MARILTVIDRISPAEAHLPPSQRTWARIIYSRTLGYDVLELRDPNAGLGGDPDAVSRHQYLVARDRLWTRRLPPAPLSEDEDETPWRDDPAAARWQLAETRSDSLIAEWARDAGLALSALSAPRTPIRSYGARNPHGTGSERYVLYRMPLRDPVNPWGDITSYQGAPVACPVASCQGDLVWYEAGYVPGYRVCMRPSADGHDPQTIRHHFVVDHQTADTLIQLRRR